MGHKRNVNLIQYKRIEKNTLNLNDRKLSRLVTYDIELMDTWFFFSRTKVLVSYDPYFSYIDKIRERKNCEK